MGTILGLETGMGSASEFASGTGAGNTITWVLIALLIVISGAIIIWIWLQNKKYKYKIKVFENIAGQGYQLGFKDRAMLVKLGDGGEEILFLKKKKVYRTAYGKKMGKNDYWFAIGQDGYWYNFLLGDLDAKMGMLDIEPIDRDMRYMHVAIRKNITDRYRKVGFMEKYGTLVIGGVMILILLAGVWFMLDKVGELMSQSNKAVDILVESNTITQKALAHVDTIMSGGSGISPA